MISYWFMLPLFFVQLDSVFFYGMLYLLYIRSLLIHNKFKIKCKIMWILRIEYIFIICINPTATKPGKQIEYQY